MLDSVFEPAVIALADPGLETFIRATETSVWSGINDSFFSAREMNLDKRKDPVVQQVSQVVGQASRRMKCFKKCFSKDIPEASSEA